MNQTNETQLQQLPAETVAYQTERASYLNAGELLARVRSWAVTMGYFKPGPQNVVFLDAPSGSIDAAEREGLEVWVPVRDDARTTPDDEVQIKQVPATAAVVRTIRGAYDPLQVPALYRETAEWLTAHSYSQNGPARWRYLDDPARLERAQDLESQLIFPVSQAGAPQAAQ
jgi:effector-binding domain-containing protein